jgi:hypothetical protein
MTATERCGELILSSRPRRAAGAAHAKGRPVYRQLGTSSLVLATSTVGIAATPPGWLRSSLMVAAAGASLPLLFLAVLMASAVVLRRRSAASADDRLHR